VSASSALTERDLASACHPVRGPVERNGKIEKRMEAAEARLDEIEKRLPLPGRKKG
jgi:hypothetical protein